MAYLVFQEANKLNLEYWKPRLLPMLNKLSRFKLVKSLITSLIHMNAYINENFFLLAMYII